MDEYFDDLVPFSTRLLEALKQRGVSQWGLARLSGIGNTTINNYCHGTSEPVISFLIRIAKALNINPMWLCGFDVPMELENCVSVSSQEAQAVDESDELKTLVKACQKNPRVLSTLSALTDSLMEDGEKRRKA